MTGIGIIKGHIAAHDFEPHEVKEVLANQPIHIETRIDPRAEKKEFSTRSHK
jgi:hypothetical protein